MSKLNLPNVPARPHGPKPIVFYLTPEESDALKWSKANLPGFSFDALRGEFVGILRAKVRAAVQHQNRRGGKIPQNIAEWLATDEHR